MGLRAEELRRRILSTYTPDGLTALGYEVPKAFADKKITPEEFASLVEAGKARRALIIKVAELARRIAQEPPPEAFDPDDEPFSETELGARARSICTRIDAAPDEYAVGVFYAEACVGPLLSEKEERAIERAKRRRLRELAAGGKK